MKLNKIFIIMLLLPSLFVSCMDVIEKPDSSSAGEYIWNDYNMARMYLDNLYLENMPVASWGGNMSNTEEAYGSSATDLLYGSASIGTVSDYSSEYWAYLRRINLMIQELRDKSTLPETDKNKLMGQARFLRAIRYWQLVRLYGGIPIVDKPIDIAKDDQDIQRSSTKACIEFIFSDLDYAASVLPADWKFVNPDQSDYGRLTSLAALSFKGRVLLTFASPMFTERDAYTAVDQTSVPAFSVSEIEKKSRWDNAFLANKVAYDSLIAHGYTLMPDFKTLFNSEGSANTEAIIVRVYTGNNYRHSWESRIRPASQNGTGYSINPTWELAKSFLTKDGKRVTEAGSGYQDKYYWVDRDPRFYQTLVYNGEIWNMGGSVGRKQWCYLGTNSETSIAYSGFYCCKAQDASLLSETLGNGKIDWIEMRFAEVLLNLAECANETNHKDVSIQLIRTLRKRAGIIEGNDPSKSYGVSDNLSKEDMLDLIINERLIELAFENQRYWDLRRRMMYTRNLSSTTLKLNDTRRRAVDNAPKSSQKDWLAANKDTLTLTTTNYYNYFLSFYLKKLDSNPNASSLGIKYLPDYYFLPIPSAMFSNSAKLEQTIGWASGTFDPLAE
jgi:hypothetical protein